MSHINKIRTIALLTDFGLQDGYVGIMKGAIATIVGQESLLDCIDITHNIPPQNLWAGRFCLMNAAPYFPLDTIFLGVVDPGVGSQRRGIAIAFREGFFVGPDNGLASGLLELLTPITAVVLENAQYWRSPANSVLNSSVIISQTFHGRDIFAPVAAHLALGLSINELGKTVAIADLKTLQLSPYKLETKALTGTIQYIDYFGNLITNIPNHCADHLQEHIQLGDRTIPLVSTYSDVPLGQLCLLQGSHGWLELSANQTSAQIQLHSAVGEAIVLII